MIDLKKSSNNWLRRFLFGCLVLSIVAGTNAQTTAKKIDQLTKQWLETERQITHLKVNWRSEKPIIEQRIKLLKLEKKQLNTLLENNKVSTSDVEQQREILLKQQAMLENEQAITISSVNRLKVRLDNLYALLPPPLKTNWQTEITDNNSILLEQQLTRLSKLKEFNQRITLHSMRLNTEQGNEVLVKQIYLGLSQAWFASQNGAYVGYGLVKNGMWKWHFSNDISSQQVLDAIAVVENQKTAQEVPFEIKQLPIKVVL